MAHDFGLPLGLAIRKERQFMPPDARPVLGGKPHQFVAIRDHEQRVPGGPNRVKRAFFGSPEAVATAKA